MFNSSTSSPGSESPASKPKSRLTLTFRPRADEPASLPSTSSSAASPVTSSCFAESEPRASKPKPRLTLTYGTRVDEPSSLASSSGSVASPFSMYGAKSRTLTLMPFTRYFTSPKQPFPPFPQLVELINYCCEINLLGAVDVPALEEMLALLEAEFKRYNERSRHGVDFIKDQIIGYLNFALVSIEEIEEHPLFNEAVAEVQGLISSLFSNALASFLKNTRMKEAMDAGFLGRVCDSAAPAAAAASAPAVVVAKKSKALSEPARRLLTSIRKNKLYEVQGFLSARPILAIEGNKELTILSEAAYIGAVGVLESIIGALNRLADLGELPGDYYGRLVGDDEGHELPAVLWAAVNGKFDALKYLYSIEGIKASLQLIHIEEAIAEAMELGRDSKATSYDEIVAFLQMMHRDLSPAVQAKEPRVLVKGAAVADVSATQITCLSSAIHAGDTKKVEILLMADPRIAAHGNSRKSTFSEATCFGNVAIVKLVMSNLPPDYNYGQFLGGEDAETQQSAVLMSALAGQKDILLYLLSIPAVIRSIAPREILSAIKKLEDYLAGEKDDRTLEEDYGWSFNRYGVSKSVYSEIYNFLYDFYFNNVARAEVPKIQREAYLEPSASGYGTMFTHKPAPAEPLAGSKRGFADFTDTAEERAAPRG